MTSGRDDARLPQAAATFLFTDVERHTELWEVDADAMAVALAGHEALIRDAVVSVGGRVVKYDGDAVMAVFDDPSAGVEAARRAQVGLAGVSWPVVGSLRVRMGLHTGTAFLRDGDYYGPSVIRAARLCDAAHGGQIVASAVVAVLASAEWIELGEYVLRGLGTPETVRQLVAAGLQRDFPPLRAAMSSHDRFPRPVTSFVGRAEELHAIVEALRTRRVVTLTGVGGAGKTRLALEAARAVLGEFLDGVAFVDFSLVTDEDNVGPAVVAALDLRTSTTGRAEAPAARLIAYLACRRALVVFDNCEHVIDKVAELVDELTSRCEDLRILATSREALQVADERVIAVGSLDVEREAVRLFCDRAALRVDDTAVVATICKRLDGIPLAIELAAARTTHLSIEEIAARLDDRFRLLTGGRRRVERQQTLQATLDWSYDLLSDHQRTLLRQLAVFVGPFTLEAAEGVCANRRFDVLDTLGALVERSMVNHDPRQRRYRLLETVRVYAEAKLLAAGEAATARRRHRDWFLTYACGFPIEATFFERSTGERLLEHLEDIEAAVRWSIDANEWEAAAQIATRLAMPAGLATSASLESWAWEIVPRLPRDSDAAFHLFLAAVWGAPASVPQTTSASASRRDSQRRTANVLNLLATEAAARSDDVSVFARAVTAFLLDGLGRVLDDEPLMTSADRLLQDALDLADARPPSIWTGYARIYAAYHALSQNSINRAGALLTGAVDSGPDTVREVAEPIRAFVLHMLGDPSALKVARQAAQHATVLWSMVAAVSVIGLELAAAGDLSAARHELSSVVPELTRASSQTKTNLVIAAAGVATISGDHRRAARWLACAASGGATFAGPDGIMLYRGFVGRVHDALSPNERTALREQGRSLSIDSALEELNTWQ
jgi:predicted ATPase/class 3 adenylate cyclase